MKISIDDIINNYQHWFHDKQLAKYDIFIEYKGNKYELYAINLRTNTVSYVENKKVITIPLSEIKELVVEGYQETA